MAPQFPFSINFLELWSPILILLSIVSLYFSLGFWLISSSLIYFNCNLCIFINNISIFNFIQNFNNISSIIDGVPPPKEIFNKIFIFRSIINSFLNNPHTFLFQNFYFVYDGQYKHLLYKRNMYIYPNFSHNSLPILIHLLIYIIKTMIWLFFQSQTAFLPKFLKHAFDFKSKFLQ